MIQLSKKMAIILGVLIIAVIIILITFVKKSKPGIDYKELIKAKDETIKAIENQRDIYKGLIAEKDLQIEQHFKNDSLLLEKSKQIQIRYDKIPVYINSLDREGLRAAGERAAQ